MRTIARLVALCGVGLVAQVSAAAAQIPVGDSVVGSGVTGGAFFEVDAHSGPSGENPGGTFTVFGFAHQVSCLQVSGNTAVIGIDGNGAFLRFVDGPVDTLAAVVPGPPIQWTCTLPPPFPSPPTPLMSGDIVVTDTRPLPTSKEQCKNGGWRTFGVFKNQGDCVSFVATGGNNPASTPP